MPFLYEVASHVKNCNFGDIIIIIINIQSSRKSIATCFIVMVSDGIFRFEITLSAVSLEVSTDRELCLFCEILRNAQYVQFAS